MHVGDLEVLPVVDGVIRGPASMFYPSVTEEQWEPHKQFLADGNMLEMPTGGFLVRNSSYVALIDVGMGFVERMPELGGKLLDSLAEHGHKPEDVTDVLFSHLHFDHIGWSSKDGAAVFPNATYRCHSKDWDHFITKGIGQGPLADRLKLPPTDTWLGPVASRFEFWDTDSAVLPGIDVCDAPGHTPGSTVMVLSSGDERAVLLGDAVHCPVELLDEEWALVGDVDPALAKRTREALAREYEGSDIPLGAPHFPDMKFGRLLPAQGKLSFLFD